MVDYSKWDGVADIDDETAAPVELGTTREAGNALFKQKKYAAAIATYSALLDDADDDEKALLLCNRSACLLAVDNVLQASRDNPAADLSATKQVGSRQPIDGASYAAAAIALAHKDASKPEEGVSSHPAAAAAGGGKAGGAAEHDPLYDHENPSKPCGARHPTFRLAMLIPWVNELPPWLSYFVATAKLSEYA